MRDHIVLVLAMLTSYISFFHVEEGELLLGTYDAIQSRLGCLPYLVISACCTSSYLEMLAKLTVGVCDCFPLDENKGEDEVEVEVDVDVKVKNTPMK